MMKSSNRGGAREGAGRPRRNASKAKPIWCGQLSEEERELVLTVLTAEERRQILLDAVESKAARSLPEAPRDSILQ